MADLVQVPVVASQGIEALNPPRHSALVRLTHWINTVSFLALLVSGIAILLAQPALFWGETGFFSGPSLLHLPLTQNEHQSGWGRSLHFLGAWIFVLNGSVYFISGLFTDHFRRNLLPARGQFSWHSIRRTLWRQLRLEKPRKEELGTYNCLQRLAYAAVIFLLSPLVIVSGLAMSPAVAAALPPLVETFGGYQSARTIHFLVMSLLVLFLVIHVVMVSLPGFRRRMRAMILGRTDV